MHLGADTGLVEVAHELGAGGGKGGEIDVDHIKMPRVAAVLGAGDGAHGGGQGGEGLIVRGRYGLAVGQEAVELA